MNDFERGQTVKFQVRNYGKTDEPYSEIQAMWLGLDCGRAILSMDRPNWYKLGVLAPYPAGGIWTMDSRLMKATTFEKV